MPGYVAATELGYSRSCSSCACPSLSRPCAIFSHLFNTLGLSCHRPTGEDDATATDFVVYRRLVAVS